MIEVSIFALQKASPAASSSQEGSFQSEKPQVHDVSDTSIQEINSPTRTNNISIQEVPSSPETPVVLAQVPVHPSPSEIIRIRKDLEQKELLLKSCRVESLPDRGARLMHSIRVLREKLASSEAAYANSPARKPATSSRELDEDELRKKIQMKKVSFLVQVSISYVYSLTIVE